MSHIKVSENILFSYFIDNQVNPETFRHNLKKELISAPQPQNLIEFLKTWLPYLQRSLFNGKLSIDGVRPPPFSAILGAVPNQVQQPQIGIQRPQMKDKN